MQLLRARSSRVLPPSSDRKRALRVDWMMAYTTFGFDGALVQAIRPQGCAGSPLALLSSNSFQVAPPSVVWKRPLPLGAVAFSPPERKVQPFRRKSHMPAKRTFGSCEFMEIIEQPVDRFTPFRILLQFFPPSVALSTPRSSLSPHSFPRTH